MVDLSFVIFILLEVTVNKPDFFLTSFKCLRQMTTFAKNPQKTMLVKMASLFFSVVACYATQHPSMSVFPSIHLS